MIRKIALTLIPGVALFTALALVATLTHSESSPTTTIAARSGYIVASS